MKFEKIYEIVGRNTLMSKDKALELYNFIIENQPLEIFEMGFYYGGSANIMAAAQEEVGGGRVVTYDFSNAKEKKPNIMELLNLTGLKSNVRPVFCDWCCEWEIAKILEENVRNSTYSPYIDFAFFDGGHNWNSTGYAFYLVSNLLKPGGWILFDDLSWSIDTSRDRDAGWTKRFPKDAREKCMVGMIFELLVKPHPDFQNFRVTQNGDWGWAQKKAKGI